MTGIFKWLLAGLAGGVVGAAAWAGISYLTNYEIGWIAWGIGAGVGACVRMAAGNEEGPLPGVTAGAIAIVAVLAGKFAAVWLTIGGMNLSPTVSPESMIARRADMIVEARVAEGKPVDFPSGKTLETARVQADYPPDIWDQASAQWAGLTAEQQQTAIQEEEAMLRAVLSNFRGQFTTQVFLNSFSFFDALWFFLAAATAYRLGSGAASSSDD